eukprot:8501366-Ditylum_brightwellii.AAC.1
MATIDIPGAYLNTDMDEEVIMKLEGMLSELLVKLAPQLYQKYVSSGKNNKPVLYVQLQKALYSYLKSVLWEFGHLAPDYKVKIN